MNLEELNDTSKSSKEQPEGWTKEDKFKLYQGLRASGSSKEIGIIRSMLPNKTEEEIAHMVHYYKEKAKAHPTVLKKKKKKRHIHKLARVPLALWSKALTDTLNFSDLQTETANALRMIAECENLPTPYSTGNVDFRKIYFTVADAMEGKSLSEDSQINQIIESCLVETAYVSKSFIHTSTIKNIVHSVNLDEKPLSVLPRPTESHELATIRHLASQKNYNPLNVTEKYLKPSVYAPSVDDD